MSRSITSALQTELDNAVTTPAYLVEIAFASPLRLSSRSTLAWNGASWAARSLSIQGLRYDIGSPQQRGTLNVGDLDLSMTAVILGEGVAGRSINIWKFYGAAPDPDDPVQIFAGVGDKASMGERAGSVSIGLIQRSVRELYAPRRFMTRANGFSILPVAGQVIAWNGGRYKLERYRG